MCVVLIVVVLRSALSWCKRGTSRFPNVKIQWVPERGLNIHHMYSSATKAYRLSINHAAHPFNSEGEEPHEKSRRVREAERYSIC